MCNVMKMYNIITSRWDKVIKSKPYFIATDLFVLSDDKLLLLFVQEVINDFIVNFHVTDPEEEFSLRGLGERRRFEVKGCNYYNNSEINKAPIQNFFSFSRHCTN